MSRIISVVDMEVQNNVTWEDGFQFGEAADTSWSFIDKVFSMDLKFCRTDTAPVFTLSSANNRIVVDDPALRILHMNVSEAELVTIEAYDYVYDLIMTDSQTGERVPLMTGTVKLTQGVTMG